jgi:hypothetical protein
MVEDLYISFVHSRCGEQTVRTIDNTLGGFR